MNNYEYIYNELKDIKGKTPILLIGGASIIFKQIYKDTIYRIENTEDAKELISNFYNINYDKILVVEDISLLYKDSILLKLIEEIKLPLILLASEDNISIPLYSRIKKCIKLPIDYNTGCNFISVKEAQIQINQDEISGKQLDKFLAENCPDLALIYKDIEIRKNKDKLIQILGGLLK